MLLEMLAETGDKRTVFFHKAHTFNKKLNGLATNFERKITDEQFEKLANIVEQFESILNDFIESEGLEEK